MVQGGVLMAHPESVHVDGEAPGGESSLRQGAGTASPGSLDLETAAAAKHRREWKKGARSRGFPRRGLNIGRRGQPGGLPGAQAPPRRGPTPGRATRAPGSLVGPLWLPLGY